VYKMLSSTVTKKIRFDNMSPKIWSLFLANVEGAHVCYLDQWGQTVNATYY
jgi:hypothetical protein